LLNLTAGGKIQMTDERGCVNRLTGKVSLKRKKGDRKGKLNT
jgi:hypothetical protein